MYRGVIIPARALEGVVSALSKRIINLERRIRWPGAVQFGSDASQAITGSTPGAPTYFTALSLTLDPGVWILMFGTNLEMSGYHASSLPLIGLLRMGGAEMRWSTVADGINTWQAPIVGFVRVAPTVQTTYALEVAVTVLSPGTSSGTARESFAIAEPA